MATNTQKIALVLGYQNRTANDGKHVDSFAGRAPWKLFQWRNKLRINICYCDVWWSDELQEK
ncbi:MAG: hypothetical protein WB037_16025 [Pseudolabrys sp.]